MSTDLQYISLVNELQLVRIEEITGADPRSLRIVGRGGFNTAQRVVINDYGLDNFTLVSDTVIVVDLPDLFEDVPAAQMTFAVVSGQYTGIGKARLVFGPTLHVRKVSGLQKLIQQVVKVLLSKIGSNKFNPGQGGGLVEALGDNLSPSGKSKISAAVAMAITNTEAQVIAAQTGALSISASERLLSFTLVGIEFVGESQSVNAILKLTSYAGRTVSFPLTL